MLKKWMYGLVVAVISAIGDAILLYITVANVSPEVLGEPKAWNAMVLFIGFNCLKTVGAHFKNAPVFFNKSSELAKDGGADA